MRIAGSRCGTERIDVGGEKRGLRHSDVLSARRQMHALNRNGRPSRGGRRLLNKKAVLGNSKDRLSITQIPKIPDAHDYLCEC
jgi:hypothetical protein